jgi:hypothetical protein
MGSTDTGALDARGIVSDWGVRGVGDGQERAEEEKDQECVMERIVLPSSEIDLTFGTQAKPISFDGSSAKS